MGKLDQLFTDRKFIELDKGKIIVYEGHKVNKIYRVHEGFVKVYTIAGETHQRVIFIYKPGDVFPLTTFLSGQSTARFFYETLTPTTLQYVTPRKIEAKLKGNLALGEEIVAYTTHLDQQFLIRVNNMVSNKSPLSKLKALLLLIADRYSSDSYITTIELPLTPSLIANMCGITTKEAKLQMKFLKSKGIISFNNSIDINTRKLNRLKT